MRKEVIFLLLLSLLILVGIAATSQWSSREVDVARDQIERALLVDEQLELFLSYTKDIETGIRGYAISGDTVFLEPFTTSLPLIGKTKQKLRRYIRDAQQQRNLPRLFALADRRIALAKEVRNSVSNHLAHILIMEGSGRRVMDALRAHVDIMHQRELTLYKAAKIRMARAETIDHWVIVGGFVLILFLQFGAFILVNKEMQHRQIAFEQLGKVNKELESFSYSVSHDLRSPLRSISGFSQALVNHKADQLDSEGRDYLMRIMFNAQRMGTLIDDLLQLSRLSRAELNKQSVDLTAVAEEIVADLRLVNPERAIDIQIEPGLEVLGDKRLVHAAMENLLNNAWKFTEKTEAAHIEVGKKAERDKTVYFVRDNGAGFDMQYANKLFGAFQRLHSMEEFAGNGVGLATVQRIMHRHGGSVWAEAEVGKGATFFFTL